MAAKKDEPAPAEAQAEEPKPGAIDLATVNKFKALTGPCLVCGKMPPGLAFGITPDQAVCAADYTDSPDESQAALEAAARGEKPGRRRGGR